MFENMTGRVGRWPVHGWIGLALVALFWALNWSLSGLRTHWGFFPLWFGYSLAVDALVFCRKGHSPLSRNAAAFAALFLISAPAWWLFEAINLRTQNWFYTGEEALTTIEYAVLSTVSFSTVMPAVFGTAELVGSFGWLRRIRTGPTVTLTPGLLRGMFAAGWAMLVCLLLWPGLFFPLVWTSVYCILEPINVRVGNPSLLEKLSRGDWRPVIALCAGCLVCGLFWEMWNFNSYPKWVYRIPYCDWLRLFEMPLPGYLGYLPFSLELFALHSLVTGMIRPEKGLHTLRLIEGET